MPVELIERAGGSPASTPPTQGGDGGANPTPAFQPKALIVAPIAHRVAAGLVRARHHPHAAASAVGLSLGIFGGAGLRGWAVFHHVLDDLPDAEDRLLSVALNRRSASGAHAIAREALTVLPAEVGQALLPSSLGHPQALDDLPRAAAALGPATHEGGARLGAAVAFALSPERRAPGGRGPGATPAPRGRR